MPSPFARRPPEPPSGQERIAALLARAQPLPEPGQDDEESSPEWVDVTREIPRVGGGPDPAAGVVTVPQTLRGAVTRPGAWALAGLAAAVVVAALVVGVRVWWVRQAAEPVPVAAAPRSTQPAAPRTLPAGFAPTTAGASPTVAPTSGATVYVHVVGKVGRPGVVAVPAGARVIDAVTKSGGIARGGDAGSVNLARPVVDGEQIVVGAPGQAPTAGTGPARPTGGPGGAPARGAASAAPGQPVDLNTADLAALDVLPGVGPVTAQRILDWRAAHGRFSSVDQLAEVPGIGEKTLARLAPLVRV